MIPGIFGLSVRFFVFFLLLGFAIEMIYVYSKSKGLRGVKIFQKNIFSNSLNVELKIALLLNMLKNTLVIIFQLSIPLILALSTIWLRWLQLIMPKIISDWITNSTSSLTSILSVLAGAYLTIFANYSLNGKNEKQKKVIYKQLSFYTPMHDELINIVTHLKSHKLLRFRFDNLYVNDYFVKWVFWNHVKKTTLKYDVPEVFRKWLDELASLINQYMDLYLKAAKCFTEIAINLSKKEGLEDTRYQSSFNDIITEIATGTFNEHSIRNAFPNNKEIALDCGKLAIAIEKNIKETKEYQEFVTCKTNTEKSVYDVYNGIDYILNRIHKKYRGKNTLL